MLNKLKQFYKNNGGNVAMTGALMMVPIIGAVGAAIDYSQFHREKVLVQSALDAAALATAKQTLQTSDKAVLEAYAKDFFLANMNDAVDEDDMTFSFNLVKGDTSKNPPEPSIVTVSVDLNYKTMISQIYGKESLAADISSQISIGNRSVEVALVMDNSGSMDADSNPSGTDRIGILKKALAGDPSDAEDIGIVNTIFNAGAYSGIADPVKFALVPFNGLVNVGGTRKNANWMDKRGWSDIHHENLNWNTYQVKNGRKIVRPTRDGGAHTVGFREQNKNDNGNKQWLTRFRLFDDMGVDWQGCVEMRPWPYNVTDDQVLTNQGYNSVRGGITGRNDGQNTLFVPYFHPDMADDNYNYRSGGNAYSTSDNNNYHSYWQPSYLHDWRIKNNPNNPGSDSNWRMITKDDSLDWEDDYGFGDDDDRDPNRLEWDPDRVGWSEQHYRYEWLAKYQAARQPDGTGLTTEEITAMENGGPGPNNECIVQDIVPLTTNKTTVLNEVAAMTAKGSTNIHQGIMWGWRLLSPGQPFTQGRAKDKLDNMKYMIVLTDGENTYYEDDGFNDSYDSPFRTFYGAWGYGRYTDANGDTFSGDERNSAAEEQNRYAGAVDWVNADASRKPAVFNGISFDRTPDDGTEYTEVMNLHTVLACNNIKNDGISIYTIAFDVPADTDTRGMMEACAGSGIRADGTLLIPDGKFYYDVDGDGLKNAMREIAAAIGDMHIIK